MEVRNKNRKPLVVPSSASIPRGQSFAFRLANAEEFPGFTIHWLFNGQRIPGAHKAEISFYHMRPRFDGEYKVILTCRNEIYASNPVHLQTVSAGAEAATNNEAVEREVEFVVFDPLAPDSDEKEKAAAAEEAAPVAEAAPEKRPEEQPEEPLSFPEKKKRAFLEKALKKTKKAS